MNRAATHPMAEPNANEVFWLSAFCFAASASTRAPLSRSSSLVTSASCGEGSEGCGLPQPIRESPMAA